MGMGETSSPWVTVRFIGVITSIAVIPLIKVSTILVKRVSTYMVYPIPGICMTSSLVSWVGTSSLTKREIAFTAFVTTSRIPKLIVWVVLNRAKLYRFVVFRVRNRVVLFSVVKGWHRGRISTRRQASRKTTSVGSTCSF